MKPSDENEIRQITMSLQPKNSSGYDNFSPCLLKLVSEQITLPIAFDRVNYCMLFQKLIDKGILVVRLTSHAYTPEIAS